MENTKPVQKIIVACAVFILAIALLVVSCATPAPTPSSPAQPAPSTSAAPSPTAAAKKTFNLRFQSISPKASPVMEAWDKYAFPLLQKIDAAHDDWDLNLKMYYQDELVKVAEIPSAVASGTIDMGFSGGGSVSGKVGPVSLFFAGAPFQYETYGDFVILYKNYGLEQTTRKAYQRVGPYVIGNWISTYVLFMMKGDFKGLADFKGKKVRTYGMLAPLIEKMGAKTVSFASSEIYTSLATGVIDGASLGPALQNTSYGLHEVSKTWILPSFMRIANEMIINQKIWDSLPASLKRALEASNDQMSVGMEAVIASQEAPARALALSKGIKFVTLSDEDQALARKLAAEVWTESAGKDPAAIEAMEISKKFLKDTGR